MIWIARATCCCSPCCPARQAGQPLILPSPGNKWLTTNALLAGINGGARGAAETLFRDDSVCVQTLMLLMAAAIWGAGFVAQRLGMDHMGPFTFSSLRFLLGALSPAAALVVAPSPAAAPACRLITRLLLTGGSSPAPCSSPPPPAARVGLLYTTAAKAGFITGLYHTGPPVIPAWPAPETGANTLR